LCCCWWNCMLKLYIHEYMCFRAKLVWNDIIVVVLLMISWPIDIVVIMRCYCCEFMLWIFIIMKIVMKFELFLRVFMKNGWIWDFCWNDVLVQVLYGFKSLFMFRNIWANFGNQFGHWGIKNWDFEAKRGFPESRVGDFCHTSTREWEASQRRVMPVITHHG